MRDPFRPRQNEGALQLITRYRQEWLQRQHYGREHELLKLRQQIGSDELVTLLEAHAALYHARTRLQKAGEDGEFLRRPLAKISEEIKRTGNEVGERLLIQPTEKWLREKWDEDERRSSG